MADNLSKIDTHGLSAPSTPEERARAKKQKHKPMMVKPRRLFEDTFVKELKILINELLDERAVKMDYKSYFDLEGREYPVE